MGREQTSPGWPHYSSGNNGVTGPAQPPGFLGMRRSDWMRLIIGWTVAITLAVGAWFLAVRDDLRDRPTRKEIHQEMVDHHAQTKATVDKNAAAVQAQRERAARIDEKLDSIVEDLREIKQAMRRRRR